MNIFKIPAGLNVYDVFLAGCLILSALIVPVAYQYLPGHRPPAGKIRASSLAAGGHQRSALGRKDWRLNAAAAVKAAGLLPLPPAAL